MEMLEPLRRQSDTLEARLLALSDLQLEKEIIQGCRHGDFESFHYQFTNTIQTERGDILEWRNSCFEEFYRLCVFIHSEEQKQLEALLTA